MSILIKGMEMPKTICGEPGYVDVRIFADGSVIMAKAAPPYYGKFEATSLSAGHGRLIDADALINELQNLFDKREKDAIFSGDRTASVTWNDAIYHIIAAPTIVPAEGGTDE